MRIRFQIRGYTPGRLCSFQKGAPAAENCFCFCADPGANIAAARMMAAMSK
jgi:hypothetical protein